MADSIYSVLKSREGGQNPYQGINLIGSGSLTYSVTGNPKLDSKRMTLTYRIATPALDREREIVLPAGVNCEHHKKNPIVLFDHQHHLPVGLSQDPDGNYTTVVAGDCLESTVWLSQKSKLSEEVYYLAENGLLNGASIGFTVQPGGERIATDESGNKIVVVERCDMHEWSTVWIPMNPDALKLGCEIVQKGFGRKRLSADVVRLYSPFMVKSPEWSNGFSAEKKAEFREEDHPRDGGQFASKPGSDGKDEDKKEPDSEAKKDDKLDTEAEKKPEEKKRGRTQVVPGLGYVPGVQTRDIKPSTPPSKAKVSYSGQHEEAAKKRLTNIFGEDVKNMDEVLASSLGAPDDAVIRIVHAGKYEGYPPMDAVGIRVMIDHPSIKKCVRFIGVDKSGKRIIKNEELYLNPKFKSSGIGIQIFAKQAEHAAAAGIDVIKCQAAKGRGLNGFYTWPRFGYDQRLDHPKVYPPQSTVFAKAKKLFPDAETVLDIFKTKEGREWWGGKVLPDGKRTKANGTDLHFAEFDLDPESRSMQVLQAYQDERKAKSSAKSLRVYDWRNGVMLKSHDPKDQDNDGAELTPDQEADIDAVWDRIEKQKKSNTDKKFSSEPSSGNNDRNRGGNMKRRIKGMEEEKDTVVDPIQDGEEDDGPVVPLGAQYLMGLHDYAMKAAEFLTENAGSMEPETAGKFVEVEKSLMNTVKVIASTFNERYPDLPPLDGADYEDPLGEDEKGDMDAEDQIDEQVDEVETDEVDKAADDADLEADSVEGEDGELDEEDSELEEKAIGEDDDEFAEDEENDEYEKSARIALGMRAKAMLHRHQERKRIEAEAKTKVPDSAVEVVKSAASLLKEISRNVGFGPLVRQKSKHQYQQLLKCLSVDNVSTKSVTLSGGLDFDEIAKKLSEIESKFLAVKADSDTLGSRIEGVK